MTLHVLCHEGREECSTSLRADDGDLSPKETPVYQEEKLTPQGFV